MQTDSEEKLDGLRSIRATWGMTEKGPFITSTGLCYFDPKYIAKLEIRIDKVRRLVEAHKP